MAVLPQSTRVLEGQCTARSLCGPKFPRVIHGGSNKILAVIRDIPAHDTPLMPFHGFDQREVTHGPKLDLIVV
eukprot:scaffold259694_cov30-Tisochrysis_lutea.AAC.4